MIPAAEFTCYADAWAALLQAGLLASRRHAIVWRDGVWRIEEVTA